MSVVIMENTCIILLEIYQSGECAFENALIHMKLRVFNMIFGCV